MFRSPSSYSGRSMHKLDTVKCISHSMPWFRRMKGAYEEVYSSPELLEDMVKNSLKSASMDHGMQYSAIYWETGHRTWLPFYASLKQKFSWKIMDDQLRKFLGIHKPTAHFPFVFYNGESVYFRSYYGDPDLSLSLPVKRNFNFSFSASGLRDPVLAGHIDSLRVSREKVFKDVLKSALKCDISEVIIRSKDDVGNLA